MSWLLPLLLLSLALWSGTQQSRASEGAFPEYRLKAAELFQMLLHLTWPTNTFAATNTPLQIGIVGENPFGPILQETLQKKTVNGHPTAIVTKKFGDDLSDCHFVFISRSEEEHLEALLEALGHKPTATLSEIDGFCRKGGMLGFVIIKEHVRFEYNKEAIEAAGLRVKAVLAAVGIRVKTEPPSR